MGCKINESEDLLSDHLCLLSVAKKFSASKKILSLHHHISPICPTTPSIQWDRNWKKSKNSCQKHQNIWTWICRDCDFGWEMKPHPAGVIPRKKNALHELSYKQLRKCLFICHHKWAASLPALLIPFSYADVRGNTLCFTKQGTWKVRLMQPFPKQHRWMANLETSRRSAMFLRSLQMSWSLSKQE